MSGGDSYVGMVGGAKYTFQADQTKETADQLLLHLVDGKLREEAGSVWSPAERPNEITGIMKVLGNAEECEGRVMVS